MGFLRGSAGRSQAWLSCSCLLSMDMDHWNTKACDLLVEPSEPQLQGLGSKRPKTLEMEQREPGSRSLPCGQLIFLCS